jgi:hypothetical protein
LSSDLTDIHRVKPEVTPACAAWVKGKIERPYSFIREGFRRGYGFIGLETANRDLLSWLCKKDERVHGTTHEVVQARFCREKPHSKYVAATGVGYVLQDLSQGLQRLHRSI